ncbi:MAG: restriction endonuclease subunit S [Paludibacteraceae bacterium]
MPKVEMKRLGDYIREVDVRNKDLKVTRLVGLTIDKAFIPSVANVIGTDLSNYKVIKKEQFACSLMQVSRDGKMPVAMFEGDMPAIMSPAYPLFEVVDTTKLLPQYLMMWFSRKEFDREACFYAVGGVRGSLTWEDFCDMTLPIPPIARQREMVAEYAMLANRIRLNNRLISTLESTAQALYRKMFVEGIDKDHLPAGWRIGTLEDVCNTQYGYTETATIERVGPNFLRITDIVNANIDWLKVPYCHISNQDFKKYKLEVGDIVISRTGANIGWAKQIKGTIPDAVFASFLIRIKVKKPDLQWLIGYMVESSDFKNFVVANQQGSAQPQANANILVKYPIIIPNDDILLRYNRQMLRINRIVYLREYEIY